MPIFDFKCTHCGHEFERLAKVDETFICPKCDEETVYKMPTVINFRTYGTGFFRQTSRFE